MGTVERITRYRPGGYHPVQLGDLFNDRYIVEHKLGFGTFSTVWLVRDQLHGRLLALKVSTADAPNGEESFLRYLNPQESKVTYPRGVMPPAKPIHDQPTSSFFPTVLDWFIAHGPNGTHQCIVTEILGPSLSSVMTYYEDKDEAFPTGFARKIGLRLVQAVNKLHCHNIVHGDLHPGNVLLRIPGVENWRVVDIHNYLETPDKIPIRKEAGQLPSVHEPKYLVYTPQISTMLALCQTSTDVCIIDFGAAQYQGPPEDNKLNRGNERPNMFPPPEFSAPEIQLEDSITRASDIWSLGCLLYTIFSGIYIFQTFELCRTSRSSTLADLTLCYGGLPERWWALWKWRSEYFEENGQLKQDASEVVTVNGDLEERLGAIPWFRPEEAEGGNNDDSSMMGHEEMAWFRRVLREIFKLEPQERMPAADVLRYLPPRWWKG